MIKDFKQYIKAYIYNILNITSLYIAVFTISYDSFLDFVSEKWNSDGLE